MARKNPFARRTNRGSAAPKPVAIPVLKLDTTGLELAYEWMPVDKMLSFRLAFEWYNANLAALMFGLGLSETDSKDLARAGKLKELGDSSAHDGEKENAYKNALQRYEKVFGKQPSDPKKKPHVLPKVDAALAATTPGKNVAAVKTVLDNLNTAYGSFGVAFRMTMGADREFALNEIHLPYKELTEMVGVAPLKAVLREASTIAKVTSLVTVDGATSLDGAKFVAQLPLVIDSVTDWALSASNVTKPVGKVVPITAKKSGGSKSVPGSITRTRKWSDNEIIHVITPGNPFKGQMQIKYALVKDGMTIGEYKKARRALGNMGAGVGPIEDGVKKGLLRVG